MGTANNQASRAASTGEVTSEINRLTPMGDKSLSVRWWEYSNETATAPPVIAAVRACEEEITTPFHHVYNAQVKATAMPIAVMANPISPAGTSVMNSAAKNCTVPTPMIAPTMRMRAVMDRRSEEHTSELQSRGHLVCRLLLE